LGLVPVFGDFGDLLDALGDLDLAGEEERL
jgi:hypothetical protein